MYLSAVQRLTLVDYPGSVACIAFTPGCNLRCGFCYNSEFVLPEKIKKIRSTFLPEYAFFRFLESRRWCLDAVVVCGGEPTIHMDLPDFLARVRSLGFKTKLDTNGSNPEMLEYILSENLVDYVAMDVKFPLERYAELTGVKISPDQYARSISLLISSKIEYEFRTTVIQPWHDECVIQSIAQSIVGTKRYYIQNFLSWETLNPAFEWYPCTTEQMERFRLIASKYVPCEIR